MHTAVVAPNRISHLLGLKRRAASVEELDRQVEIGLPKASLAAIAHHVFGVGAEATALMQKVMPPATFHRRVGQLKPQEGERVERLARVVATAEQVWGDEEDARAFLVTAHSMLGGKRPIDVALSELGARRVETLLWSLFYGVAA